MRPTFYGLETAKSALFMAQKQMDVTGHNISNANTVGFTRQRIVQQAIDPYGVMTRLKDMENGKVGAGVLTYSLDQIRDTYLDRRIRSHNSTEAYWAERYDGLYEIESLFNGELGASDTSLVKLFSDFFNAVDQLDDDKAASSLDIRTNLLVATQQMTNAINDVYSKLYELQQEHELIITEPNAGLVARVNEILSAIADYNKQIYAFEINNYNSGLPAEKALDLRDQRNLLIDELSTLIDMDYYEDTDSKLHISICGVEALVHDKHGTMTTNKIKTNPLNGEEEALSVVCFVPIGQDVNGGAYTQLMISGGSIKAHLDLRDGQKASTKLGLQSVAGIPQFVEQLNTFVRTLAKEFNDLHKQGYTFPADENDGDPITGINFFYVPLNENGVEDYSLLTIGNFRVDDMIDPDLNGSVYNIAISSLPVEYDDEGNLMLEEANNEIGLKLKELMYADVEGIGSLRKFINTFLVSIASETAVAKARDLEYETIGYELQQMFYSYSGVSQDEEMTNLIKFNYAFTAASRVITTIDEQLDVLINRMGRVGL